MKKAVVFLTIFLSLSLSGCSGEKFLSVDRVFSHMESTPIIDYAVPDGSPNVLVNQRGYPVAGEKEAAIKGKRLPQEFRLVDADTREVVYRGRINKTEYDQEQEIYIGSASFDDYEKEGTYYLECDYIGRSYSFKLEENFYNNLFQELYEEIAEDCRKNTASVKDAMALLRAYEWQGEIFRDDNADKVPDVLEVLVMWIDNIDYAQIDVSEGAAYAAFLGKFSYLYQNYDRSYATECLQRASAVFSKTQNTMQKDADTFFALTELYRASGLSVYGNQIIEYKSYFQNQGSFLKESGYLYGIMTYMLTRQTVDRELCGLFMDELLARCEEIVEVHEELLQPVHARNNGADELLKNAMELACANYVLNSYQNDRIMEEIVNYLMGCNFKSVYFYPEQGSRDEYMVLFAHLALLEQS